jgi:hypothetical protein
MLTYVFVSKDEHKRNTEVEIYAKEYNADKVILFSPHSTNFQINNIKVTHCAVSRQFLEYTVNEILADTEDHKYLIIFDQCGDDVQTLTNHSFLALLNCRIKCKCKLFFAVPVSIHVQRDNPYIDNVILFDMDHR